MGVEFVTTYNNDDEITVDFLKEKASKPFFPEGDSKLSALPPTKLELGNYAQQKIAPFKNTEGGVCTFQEYLMSTSTEEEDGISPSVSQEKEACSQLKLSGQAESVQSGVSDIFMGLGLHRAQVLGELGETDTAPLCAYGCGKKCSHPTGYQPKRTDSYEYFTESSFSVVMMK